MVSPRPTSPVSWGSPGSRSRRSSPDAAMADRERGGGPVIVPMPAEIDLANAGRVGEQLCTAADPGVTVIVADLTATQCCASAGIRSLLYARDSVATRHAQLRLAVASSGAVRRA